MTSSGRLGIPLNFDFFVILYGGCYLYTHSLSDDKVSPNSICTMVRAFSLPTLSR